MEPKTQEADTAFARIVRERQKAVFAVAYGKLGNSHDAEDVAQDVFIEAFRNFHKLKKVEKIPAWLFKATLYRCKDHVRKKSRRKNRELIFASSASPPAEEPTDCERTDAMMSAIDMLPEKFRVLVMLKHFAKLSYADISKMTGLPKTTIDGRLRTAKENLRVKLMEMGIGAS